jgi:acetyltransferase
MLTVRQISQPDDALISPLSNLLIDCVHGGASVGFLAPLSPLTAARYWEDVFASLNSGLVLWIAEDNGNVMGSVQLVLCQKENGLHRAEVMKLLVLRAYRGRGIASQLMSELESFARSEGRTLLVLDTEAGSIAETVYQHLGWTRLGEIPDYAKSPDGVLRPTAYYYKVLRPD